MTNKKMWSGLCWLALVVLCLGAFSNPVQEEVSAEQLRYYGYNHPAVKLVVFRDGQPQVVISGRLNYVDCHNLEQFLLLVQQDVKDNPGLLPQIDRQKEKSENRRVAIDTGGASWYN